MGQWTEHGFIAKTVEEYKADIRTLFTTAFGPDFIVNDETLPQCILIQELAELFANADADSIEVLTQLNPNTVSGIWLDFMAQARGLTRNAATPQVVTVAVVSNPASLPFTLPAGQVFTCRETGEQFTLESAKTISSTNDSIQIKYANGNSSVSVGNHFNTDGASGIITMTAVGIAAGKDRESDADFRLRLLESRPVFNPTIEHITDVINSLDSIRSVGCVYNDTSSTVDGMPPYTTEFLVAPTADIDKSTAQYDYWKEAVGQAILWNKVPGSPTYGSVTVNIADPFGTTKAVSFTVPETVNIGVKITASVNEEVGATDMAKIEAIKEDIRNYVNSLPVGADVAYSKIMQIFMSGSAMDVVKVTFKNMDTSTEYENQNYVIEERQYAEVALANIEVTY